MVLKRVGTQLADLVWSPYPDSGQTDTTITSNTTLSGDNTAATFTVQAGNTVTSGSDVLLIRATEQIVINGTVDATGLGAIGGDASFDPGNSGFVGGRGGNSDTDAGGSVQFSPADNIENFSRAFESPWPDIYTRSVLGGGGGASGSRGDSQIGPDPRGGNGGNGGGILLLIAPTVEINGTVLSEGQDGGDGGGFFGGGSGSGGGGGGGGGTVYVGGGTITGTSQVSVAGGAKGVATASGGSDGNPGDPGIFVVDNYQ